MRHYLLSIVACLIQFAGIIGTTLFAQTDSAAKLIELDMKRVKEDESWFLQERDLLRQSLSVYFFYLEELSDSIADRGQRDYHNRMYFSFDRDKSLEEYRKAYNMQYLVTLRPQNFLKSKKAQYEQLLGPDKTELDTFQSTAHQKIGVKKGERETLVRTKQSIIILSRMQDTLEHWMRVVDSSLAASQAERTIVVNEKNSDRKVVKLHSDDIKKYRKNEKLKQRDDLNGPIVIRFDYEGRKDWITKKVKEVASRPNPRDIHHRKFGYILDLPYKDEKMKQ